MASEEQSREEGLENFLSRRRRRGNDTTANTNNDNIIPALALSLKSRECSAMAFKHIFDQIRLHKSLASSSSSSSSPPNLEHVELAPSHVGLAENSPISHHSSLPTQGGRARQEIGTAPPPPLTSSATLRSPLNTAPQLTIFYSGTVSVYDGISADKARAIMVLAGSGQSTANPACFEAINSPLSLGLMASELPHARKASLARFLGKRKDICGPALTDVSDLKE